MLRSRIVEHATHYFGDPMDSLDDKVVASQPAVEPAVYDAVAPEHIADPERPAIVVAEHSPCRLIDDTEEFLERGFDVIF